MSSRTEQLDKIVDLALELEHQLEGADELEEITDILIDELLEVLPIPGWLPFLKGWARKRLDDFLPGGLFLAIRKAAQIVRRKLVNGGAS